MSLVAASGDQATAIVILGAIVIPVAVLGWLCWFFWKHRHDD
jgi:heme/copper-type cytochrome/quinol oxidase subunit 2